MCFFHIFEVVCPYWSASNQEAVIDISRLNIGYMIAGVVVKLLLDNFSIKLLQRKGFDLSHTLGNSCRER